LLPRGHIKHQQAQQASSQHAMQGHQNKMARAKKNTIAPN
jgi:hypothetical protein